MHCVGTYPSRNGDLNLRCMDTLRERYNVPVGYSGHERGLATTIAAVAMGACCVERHITLDRTMWGSDQAASIEPHALCRLVRDIRTIELAMGDGAKVLLDAEKPVAEKLRRNQWQTT
jgi:N-acetylneuraminate synthase